MLFPRSRMRFTKSYQGKTEPEGWIILDLTGADIDGANKVYVSMQDVEKLILGGDTASEKLKAARALLGGDEEIE